MNIKNIQTVLSHFKNLKDGKVPDNHELKDVGFNMTMWLDGELEVNTDTRTFTDDPYTVFDYLGNQCGTVACIGGWVTLLLGDPFCTDEDHATNLLGLEKDLSDKLFYPDQTRGCDYNYFDENHERVAEVFTLAAACRVLEILLNTGEVDWNRAISETREEQHIADTLAIIEE